MFLSHLGEENAIGRDCRLSRSRHKLPSGGVGGRAGGVAAAAVGERVVVAVLAVVVSNVAHPSPSPHPTTTISPLSPWGAVRAD